jgi:hypothetical protein
MLRRNRKARRAVAAVLVGVSVWDAAGKSWTYLLVVVLGLEVVLPALVLRYVLRWHRRRSARRCQEAAFGGSARSSSSAPNREGARLMLAHAAPSNASQLRHVVGGRTAPPVMSTCARSATLSESNEPPSDRDGRSGPLADRGRTPLAATHTDEGAGR